LRIVAISDVWLLLMARVSTGLDTNRHHGGPDRVTADLADVDPAYPCSCGRAIAPARAAN
jgi:hypothetical protein